MVTLNKWFELMGLHPWHSWQLANQLIPINSACNASVFESAWQAADRVGRSDIRRAIARAEDLFKQYTNYEARPKYKTATLPWATMGDYRITRFVDSNPYGRWLGYQLPEGYIRALGYQHTIDHGQHDVVYTDEDGDGLYETATLTVNHLDYESLDEILIEFVPGDYLYEGDANRVYPRHVFSTGNHTTIVMDTPTLIKPILATRAIVSTLDPSILPPNVKSPFPRHLNVSRQYCDPDGTTIDTAQAVLIWETAPFPAWARPWSSFGTITQDPSALAYAIARGNIRNSRQGIVYAGESVYDDATGTWTGNVGFAECRPPDRVLYRYLAGVDDYNTDIVISRLAAAELSKPICACSQAQRMVSEWQIDISRTSRDESYIMASDINNPLGVKRGHLYAWRSIQQSQILTGLLA